MRDLPPITKHGWVKVVRGDMVEGGFKRLAIDGIFSSLPKDELVFCTNSHGFGGIALTLSLDNTAKRPTIFLSKNDKMSPNLEWCQRLGARLDFSGDAEPANSPALREEAKEVYSGNQYEILPIGLDTPAVRRQIASIAKAIFPVAPKELWVTAASGLVVSTLSEAFPFTKIYAVLVKHNAPNIGRAIPRYPEEKFDEPAILTPPYKSAEYYDAKTWAECLKHGTKGACILNIA